MRILHISPQEPSMKSGGGLGVLQTLLSLKSNLYDVDYVGPEIKDKIIVKQYKKCHILLPDINIIHRVINILKGITNSRYNAWNRLSLKIDLYDVIVIDFTKLNYVLPKLRNKPILVKVHNVEYDYSKNDYKKDRSLSKWILASISFYQEKEILERANKILVLTENDRYRLLELYGDKLNHKITLNPVAIPSNDVSRKEKGGKLKMLVAGSLWYSENVSGIIWFVRNVLSQLDDNFELTIAGAGPSNKFKEILRKYQNIHLVDTPQSMAQYFKDCDLFVAPIFNGAGMKIKVAEALSYGKPVLGTDHAFIGYKIQEGYNSFRANSVDEFIYQLKLIFSLDNESWRMIVDNAIELFHTEYSIENSAKQWKMAIEELIYFK